MSVTLGTITGSSVRPEYVMSLLRAKELGAGVIMKPCLYLHQGRNDIMVEWYFNQTQSDWLIFIDDDMEFNWEELLRLTARPDDRPLVGGLYISPFKEGLGPVVYRWTDHKEFGVPSFVRYEMSELLSQERDEYGLTQVGAVGTGCLAIHRTVAEKMYEKFDKPTPWFDMLAVNGVNMGEDLVFGARTGFIGFPTYIDTSVRCSHFKTFRFHPDYIDQFLPKELWVNTNGKIEVTV